MTPVRTLELSCSLDAAPEEVWTRVTSFAGVNDELRPVLRMTWPEERAGLGIAQAPVGTRLCRSWLLLLGVLPVGFAATGTGGCAGGLRSGRGRRAGPGG